MAASVRRKQVQRTRQDQTTVEVGPLIDQYGDLQAEIAKLKKKLAPTQAKIAEKTTKMAELRETIEKDVTHGLADGSSCTQAGTRFLVTFGKRKMNRQIKNIERIAELMGEHFAKVVSIPLKAVDDYLNPEEREEVIETTHDGARSFKVGPR